MSAHAVSCSSREGATAPGGDEEGKAPECGRTAEADEEVRDVEHVRRVARRVVVHPVRLAALIRDDVEQDVHRAVAVLRRGAVPASARVRKACPCAEACQYSVLVHTPRMCREDGERDAQDRHAEDDRFGPGDAEHGELAVALRAPVQVQRVCAR